MQGLTKVPSGSFFAALLLGMVVISETPTSHAANCSGGVAEINEAVEKYNRLKGCAKGTQVAVRAGLLQRIIELRKENEGCPNITGGNSVAELQHMLDNLKRNAAVACDLEEMSNALDTEIDRLDKSIAEHERLAKAYGRLAELTGKAEPMKKSSSLKDLLAAADLYEKAAEVSDGIEQTDLSKSFRKQADDLKKKAKALQQKPKAKTPEPSSGKKKPKARSCADALAYIKKLKAAGTDTAPVEKAYKDQGCD